MLLRLIAVMAWLLVALSSAGAEPVDAGFNSPTLDLMPALQAVQSMAPETAIDLPADASGQKQTMPLRARGPGPAYRWAVFTLRNGEDVQQEIVLTVPHQRFVGSGLLWPLPSGSRILGVEASGGPAVQPLTRPAADSFALTIPPRTTVTYALEVTSAGLEGVSLWQRNIFDAAVWQSAFLRGVLLGIAMLTGVAMVSLMIVKQRALFAAGALLMWSAIAFLAVETGHGPAIASLIPGLTPDEDVLRAVVEALMLLGLVTALVSLVDLRRRLPTAGAIFAGLVGGALALSIYGWFEPRVAAGMIRIMFAGVAVAGLVIIVVLWRGGVIRAKASLAGWLVLTAWTALAAAGAFELLDRELMQRLLLAGLLVVILSFAFTLVQFAFDRSIASSRFFEDSGRRALALAGSDQAVWDWQSNEGPLFIGPEVERALGLEPGTLAGTDTEGWLDLIHPADRASYAAAVEAAQQRGRGSFSQPFRLRRVDGSFRWYLLRGKAMPGEHVGAARLIGTLADVTAQRVSEDRLLADAVRDRVTGLPNLALFVDRLDQAMRRARSANASPLHVIVVGFDGISSLIDTFGHDVGDGLYKTIAQRLSPLIGPDDTLARLPGDRYGVIVTDPNAELDIIGFSAALADAVSQPLLDGEDEIIVTASIGVASLRAEARDPEELISDAEIALHEAKRRGGGAVEFFSPDMRGGYSELVGREQELRNAIERHEIEVVYQPIVRLANRELAGFEALMRWRRAGEVDSQERLLALARECGLIEGLAVYALKEAGRHLGIWQRAFRPERPLFVAIDVPSADLLNGDLVDDLGAMMEREGISAGTLILELTERAIGRNPELVHKVLQRLKHIGVALACEDYGIGNSDLASLAQLPFDMIKLDPVLLETPSGDDRHLMVLQAVVRLAHDLKLSVVAEGIETEDQIERLAEIGCDYGEGYHIGPPVMARKVTEALGDLPYSAGAKGSGLAALLGRVFDSLTPGRGTAFPKRAEEDSDMVLDVTGIMPSGANRRGPAPGPVHRHGRETFGSGAE